MRSRVFYQKRSCDERYLRVVYKDSFQGSFIHHSRTSDDKTHDKDIKIKKEGNPQ